MHAPLVQKIIFNLMLFSDVVGKTTALDAFHTFILNIHLMDLLLMCFGNIVMQIIEIPY